MAVQIQRYVGVDFGTSTSVMRVKRYRDSKPVDSRLDTKTVVFDASGSVVVPSLIRSVSGGELYGYEAAGRKRDSTLYQSFKIGLESTDDAKRKESRSLTKDFLKYLGRQYITQSEGGHLGESDDEERTIISYPVKWSDETKNFMIAAAEEAGFKNVEGMDEASAAIHAVTIQSEDYLKKKRYLTDGTPVNILLIDMGAGTTDLVVCRYTPGTSPKNEILCTWPERGGLTFGGREVDELLRNHIKSKLSEKDAEKIMQRVGITQFKAWKESSVSPALKRNETVSEFADLDNILDMLEIDIEDYSLDRAKFESLAKEYLEQFTQLIDECIKASGLDGGDIDMVITTGGHSQWYFVDELIRSQKSLKKINEDSGRIVPIPRPHETVALGLVYSPMSAQVEKPKQEPVHVSKEPDKQQSVPDSDNTAKEHGADNSEPNKSVSSDDFYRTGCIYLRSENYEGAVTWFQKAALEDNPRAQYILARLYLLGKGCVKNELMAYRWLEKASRLGHKEAGRLLDLVDQLRKIQRIEQLRIGSSGDVKSVLDMFFANDEDFEKIRYNYVQTSNISVFRQSLNIPSGDKIYLMHDTSWFRRGKNGSAICGSGIYYNPLNSPSPVITWNMFILYELCSKSDGLYLGDRKFPFGSSSEWVNIINKLQKCLRDTEHGRDLIKNAGQIAECKAPLEAEIYKGDLLEWINSENE